MVVQQRSDVSALASPHCNCQVMVRGRCDAMATDRFFERLLTGLEYNPSRLLLQTM